MFSLIEHYVPKFSTLNNKKKLELLLTGINIENEEFLPLAFHDKTCLYHYLK